MPAVIAFDYEPIVRAAGFVVRLDTLVAAAGVLVALLAGGALARSTPVRDEPERFGGRLRLDDLLFVALAAAPGALIGGRLGYVLLHAGYYAANPAAILDPSIGSLELTLAVAGGALTGGIGAHVLSLSAGRWFHVAAVPMLLALGIGKVAMALGGRGQGTPWDGGWATAYLGPGPWGSIAPEVPSHPSQLYEAVAIGLVVLVVVGLDAAGVFERRNGTAFLVALAGFAVARFAVAATWRDPVVLGPLRAEQVIAAVVVLACLVLAVVVARPVRRPFRRGNSEPDGEPHWPEPETRPNF